MSIKLYTDSLHKIAYSTDGSVYREVPLGVAYPQHTDDIIELLSLARQRHTHLIARAGGTSVAGQVVGSGIVADVSRHLTRILEVNAHERWARVQPGVVRDELNAHLKPYGLFFSPETSTSNRCCIGGMMGNNSCGTHSLVYGSTRHHVLEAVGVLTDGSVETFKTYSVSELEQRFGTAFWQRQHHPTLAQSIYAQLLTMALDPDTVQLIDDTYPDPELRRRSCGYALDEVLAPLRDTSPPLAERTVNLCQLLTGSEGTLAIVTEIKVSLDPLPPSQMMVVCAHCHTVEASFEANLLALRHHPTAIELMDGEILQLSKGNVEQERNRFFVTGDPAALLITELRADSRQTLDQMADALEADLMASGLVELCTRVYGPDVSRVWALRKAGLGVLSSMKGDTKPTGVIEDTAVAPQRLPAYMRDFGQLLQRLDTRCVYYGHISTGELHLRPILNLKSADDRALFRQIAHDTTLLVKRHRGSISGEHGDGRLRGEFIRLQYGEATYQLMRQVKQCWDPDGLLNLHKIVDTLPMDSMLRYDVGQTYAIAREWGHDGTYLNWKGAFDDCTTQGSTGASSQVHALMCSIEQCNGAGDCRKSSAMGGTMCPAYKVSRDETRSTRARANVLRELLTRGWDSEALSPGGSGHVLDIAELKQVLDECLACKGCRSECPSNVDMTRLRAELLQHWHDRHGTPLRTWLVARMAQVEGLGALLRPVYNAVARWRPTASLVKRVVGFAPQRTLPQLSRHSMRWLVAHERQRHPAPAASKGTVYLLADEFTDRHESHLGLTLARLLTRLGYDVQVPRHVESGRAAISKGCLRLAQRHARRNFALLRHLIDADHPLVGIEPSCILSFRDEYPDLVAPADRHAAKALGQHCLLYDEFIVREMQAGRISADDFSADEMDIWLHGHCHQKALVGIGPTVQALGLLSGARVHVIASGCCGMAGSFGYEREHYQTSLAIGEMVLFPAVRQAMSQSGVHPAYVAAPGTSCRQQILDGTGIHAVHPLQLLDRYLATKSHAD
ncbi:MAG: FAD-binding protein [Muribaculaceae bacterium]|nr:FAD-binding protein [Muribaculaceae bacterium]